MAVGNPEVPEPSAPGRCPGPRPVGRRGALRPPDPARSQLAGKCRQGHGGRAVGTRRGGLPLREDRGRRCAGGYPGSRRPARLSPPASALRELRPRAGRGPSSDCSQAKAWPGLDDPNGSAPPGQRGPATRQKAPVRDLQPRPRRKPRGDPEKGCPPRWAALGGPDASRHCFAACPSGKAR